MRRKGIGKYCYHCVVVSFVYLLELLLKVGVVLAKLHDVGMLLVDEGKA